MVAVHLWVQTVRHFLPMVLNSVLVNSKNRDFYPGFPAPWHPFSGPFLQFSGLLAWHYQCLGPLYGDTLAYPTAYPGPLYSNTLAYGCYSLGSTHCEWLWGKWLWGLWLWGA
jgi:hypothetical protein